MEDRTIIEWDKDDLDALGILKVDVLALGMLTCIRKALRPASQQHYGQRPRRSPPCRPRTTRGLRHDLPRRHARRLPDREPGADVDAAAAEADEVLRPRHRGGDRPARPDPGRHGASLSAPPRRARSRSIYPKPELEEVLDKTLGVPLFQEQAMQIAIVAAGFTPGEADQLRRAMATFQRTGTIAQLPRQADRRHGRRTATSAISPSAASSRSRASATTASPKATPPASRCSSMSRPGSSAITPTSSACALLNSQPMGFYAPAQLVRDAVEHGVEVRPLDVNHSDWDCTLELPTTSPPRPPEGGEGRGEGGFSAPSDPRATSPAPSPPSPSPSASACAR